MRLQLAHQLPGTHRGIGGWGSADRDPAFDAALADLDRAVLAGTWDPAGAVARPVVARGVTWLLVPTAIGAPWQHLSAASCGGWSALPLGAPAL